MLEEHSYPFLIKEDLNTLNVGVINGAQNGYSVEQERLFGVSLIERLKPDIVILGLFADNDIKGDYYKEYSNIDVKFGYRLRKDRWLQLKVVDYLRTHSYSWMFASRQLNRLKSRKRGAHFKVMLRTSLRDVIRPTFSSIVKLKDFCEIGGIVFGIVMIPPESGKTVFDEPIKVFLQENEIATLDLGSRGFSKREYLQRDGHWSEEGHEKAARFLVPFVAGLVEKQQE